MKKRKIGIKKVNVVEYITIISNPLVKLFAQKKIKNKK